DSVQVSSQIRRLVAEDLGESVEDPPSSLTPLHRAQVPGGRAQDFSSGGLVCPPRLAASSGNQQRRDGGLVCEAGVVHRPGGDRERANPGLVVGWLAGTELVDDDAPEERPQALREELPVPLGFCKSSLTFGRWIGCQASSRAMPAILQRLATRDGLTEAEIKEAASKHLTKSKRSETMTMRNKRKASDAALDENEEAGEAEAEAGDDSASETSGATAGRRNGWKAGAEMVAARATMLLRAVARIFVRAAQTVFLPKAAVEVRVHEDCVHVHVPHLVQSCTALRSIQDIVEEGDTWVDMVEVMQTACQQEVVGHRLAKRQAYELAVAVLCKALADLFEGSRLEEVWSETELWHMQPLRTPGGKRRLSGSQKASVVDQTSKQHLRSASTVLASQAHACKDRQKGSDLVTVERYSYSLELQKHFQKVRRLSLCVDGVQVGSYSLLNTVACDLQTGWSGICPPQVEFLVAFALAFVIFVEFLGAEKAEGEQRPCWRPAVLAEAGPDGERAVPRCKWDYVWSSWPGSKAQAVSSAEAFAYVGNGAPSVTRATFADAFSLREVQDLARSCSIKLKQTFGTAERAWQDLQSQPGQDRFAEHCAGSGGSIMQIRKFLFGGQGDFSEAQFRLLWNELSPCPPKHYRKTPLLFTCKPGSGRARLMVSSRRTEKLADIPAGIVNLRIAARANEDIDLMLFNPVAQTWVVRWQGGLLNKNQRSGTYAGVTLSFSGDADAEEVIEMRGTLNRPLIVEVNNFGKTAAADSASGCCNAKSPPADTELHRSSWERIEEGQCPKVFQLQLAAKSGEGDSASSALGLLRFPSMTGKDGGPKRATGGLCPLLFLGEGVWQAWPSHGLGGVPWQDPKRIEAPDAPDALCTWAKAVSSLESGSDTSSESALPRQELVRNMFLEAAEHCSDASECWKATGGQHQGISQRQWEQLMQNYALQGVLPGGDQSCQRWQEMRAYTFRHRGQLDDQSGLGSAESLGIVMGSFTLLARIWAGAALESSLTQAAFRTSVGSHQPGLFAGLQGGQLTFSFGAQISACRTAYKVPADTWLEVAWIYDASNEEQRIWMNGEETKACSGAAPFRGFGQQVVAGESQSARSRLARLTSLFVFPEALETKDITAIFSQVPVTSVAVLSGQAGGATKVGPASQLGIDGGSFTLTMQLLKPEQAADGVIISGDSDSSPGLLLATRDGSLQSVVLEQICQADSPLPSGRWVQVALVFDAQHGLQRLFQDGKLAKMCQVSRLPATKLGKMDLWLGRGNVDQNGWPGQTKDLQVFSHSECAVNLQELAGGIRPKEKPIVDLSDFEESFHSLDADRNGRISADEYIAGLGGVSFSVAVKKHPRGGLLPEPAPSSQLGVPKLQAPKATPSPRQPSPTHHPADNLWVPGPASASNIMLGTAGDHDQSPPATPKPPQQVQNPAQPSAALPLNPLNRDPPKTPFNPFVSPSSPLPTSTVQLTTTNLPQPLTTPAAPPPALSTAKASRPSADNPLNQDPPAAPLNPFAMLTATTPRLTTKAFLAPTAVPVAISTTVTTEVPESTALRESSTSSFLSPAPGQVTVTPKVTFPPSFKPVKLGIPGGLSVDPLDMHPAALPSEQKPATTTAATTASTSTALNASTASTASGIGLGSMFRPFGMFEDRKLHLHSRRHLAFLSMAAMAISASSFSVVLWLRRMRSQRDAWDTWAVGGSDSDEMRASRAHGAEICR
ncbi:unnamed protein product, partial [Symbiodinium necroappetens]